MKVYRLDLRQQRCPLALLLAKRHSLQLQLQAQQQLEILSADTASIKDMINYFAQSDFYLDVVEYAEYSKLTVIKKEINLNV